MNGPDALAGVRRGVRPTLPGTSAETAASADQDTAAGTIRGSHRSGLPGGPGRCGRGPGGHGRRARPGRERRDRAAERPAGRPARLSLSNWPVSTRLAAVFVVASVTGLVFGGLRVANAVGAANAYSRTAQLAVLAEQVTALAQAMENERDPTPASPRTARSPPPRRRTTPGRRSPGRSSTALARQSAALTAAEQATDAQARRTGALADAIGSAFPASIQSRAADVAAMIRSMTGLRSEVLSAADVRGHLQLLERDRRAVRVQRRDHQRQRRRAARRRGARARRAVPGQGPGVAAAGLRVQRPARGIGQRRGRRQADAGATRPARRSTPSARRRSPTPAASAAHHRAGPSSADLAAFDNAATPAQVNAYLATVAGTPDTNVQLIEEFISQTGDPRQTFEQVDGHVSLGFDKATVAVHLVHQRIHAHRPDADDRVAAGRRDRRP